jgi:hypothetical protein
MLGFTMLFVGQVIGLNESWYGPVQDSFLEKVAIAVGTIGAIMFLGSLFLMVFACWVDSASVEAAPSELR